jgi:exodeoxyribonuclease V beta subunit
LAGLNQQGVTPELMQRLLRRLDGDPALQLDPLPADLLADQPLAPQLQALWQRRWHDFVGQWQAGGAALEQACRDLAAELRSLGVKETKPYSPAPRTDRVAQLDAWLEGLRASLGDSPASYEQVLGQPLLQSYFHPAVFTKLAEGPLTEGSPMGGQLPQRPLLEAIAAIVDGPLELVLAHGLHWGREELRRRRGSSGRLSFGDLLACLDPGPEGSGHAQGSSHGEGSGHAEGSSHADLIAAVGARYQVALVDEFQDTDPIQWRILERAFAGPAAGGPRHLLVMVGDPKQAIYRFRGGELATYRRASQRADASHSLRENRRASPALVAALNALMAPGLLRSRLAVPEVLARADHGELLLDAGESPLQLLPLESDERLPDLVAGLCLQLLQRPLRIRRRNGGGTGDGGDVSNSGDGWQERQLTPADLCLLVAKHRQAEELRSALERRQLPSRLVSRGDVFASDAAAALQRLLDALADPGNPGRQRLLAVSPLLGWTAEALAAAGPDQWDLLGDQLAGLASRLPRDGLLTCLGQLLRTEGLARLALGGRLLADLQQVAELVQERMHQLGQGAAAAADWLRRQRLDPDREVPEAHQLNSTAADAAIAVVTVHRSKGLEYPVVICPYLWRAVERPSAAIREVGRRWLPPNADGPLLDLHRSPHWGRGRAAAAENWLAQRQEAERLAYVAATRAQHLLVLGWRQERGRQSQGRQGGVGQNPVGQNPADQDNPLASWLLRADGGRRGADELPITELNPEALPPPTARWRQPVGEGELQLGPLPRQRLDNSWGRSSYTSWTHGGSLQPGAGEEGRQGDEPAPNSLAPEQPEALGDSEGTESASKSTFKSASASASRSAGNGEPGFENPGCNDPGFEDPLGPLASFPRGSGPGEALHRILERLDYGQSPNEPQARAVIEQELERAAIDASWAAALSEGLERLRLTPMGAGLGGFRLAELARQERLNELNFDLPLAVPKPRALAAGAPANATTTTGSTNWPLVRARGLADCFRRHPGGLFGEAYADDLERLELASRGFLTGSIDLVFRRGERWWVLDWKSNWLGERDAAGSPRACGPAHYGQAAMAQLMAACHYPLQAHLYLVALHRYLRWRLPGYRPQRHLGGYAYVFLRGVPGDSPSIQDWAVLGKAVPGMLVEQPPLERLLALDSLLREGLA